LTDDSTINVNDGMILVSLKEGHAPTADYFRRLLPETVVELDGLFLYYSRRASLAPRLPAFIDAAKKTLKSSK
jgi:hypothetical protein